MKQQKKKKKKKKKEKACPQRMFAILEGGIVRFTF